MVVTHWLRGRSHGHNERVSSKVRLVGPTEVVGQVERLLAGADRVVWPVDQTQEVAETAIESIPEGFCGAVVATSGSTGTPKVVLLSRKALLSAAEAVEDRLGGPGEWVNPLPVRYVAGLMTVVRAVVGGQSYISISPQLVELPRPKRRAYLSLVPAQLHRALSDQETRQKLTDYAAVLIGGGPLDAALRHQAEAAGIQIVATYGMSETCGGVIYDGLPLDPVSVRLIDESGQDGDEGRIGLAGPSLFDGYAGDPVATAAVLRDGWFWTSDRGRLNNSRLEVLGRLDEVIVTGGSNVDLALVQRLLDQWYPQQVACFAVPDPVWGALLLVASAAPGLQEIQDRLTDQLGPPAKPRGWLTMAALPRTSSGKIDRTRLAEIWRQHGERT